MSGTGTATALIAPSPSRYRKSFKYKIDAIGALLLVLPLLPLLIAISAAIVLASSTPAIYRQKRVGQGGRTFTIFKFRTMRNGSDGNGNPPAIPNDPRITKLGKFLRKYHLDELPQLFNVLAGHMSFVGPRPLSIEDTERSAAETNRFTQRHLVKPGITGLAQLVRYTTGARKTPREKLELDLQYIHSCSFFYDLSIIAKTMLLLLRI